MAELILDILLGVFSTITGNNIFVRLSYQLPVFRLIDIVLGYNIADLFLTVEHDNKNGKYTLYEIALCVIYGLFLIVLCSPWAGLRGFLPGPILFTSAYTMANSAIIYLFAVSKGLVSEKIISSKPLLMISGVSMYAYLIHPIVNKVIGYGRFRYEAYIKLTVGLCITLTISMICKMISDKMYSIKK